MSIKEIRESGMLEYYVLGLLSVPDSQKVEGYLAQYQELRQDYFEIQKTMQAYALAHGVTPSPALAQKILDTIKSDGTQTPPRADNTDSKSNPSSAASGSDSGMGWLQYLLLFLLGLGCILAAWYAFNKNAAYEELDAKYKKEIAACDSTVNAQNDKLALYTALNNTDNQALEMTATENYQETNLLFHFNPVTRQNYIQVKNIPSVATNQAFQLWSLKDGIDPIPLTVFQEGDSFLIPVDFEEGTGTYAITIEAAEGAQSPTLSRLIGTVKVA